MYVNLAYEYRKPGSAADDTPLRSAVTDVVTGKRTAYSYDPDYNQLTAAASTRAGIPVKTHTYGYNANGQRTTATVNGVATGYTYNAASQLTAVTGPGAGAAAGTYTYDANGNQTTGGARTLSYNDRDQTTAVNTEVAGYEDIDQAQRATLGTRAFLNTPLGVTRYTDPAATTDVIREPTGQLAALRRTSGTHYPITDALGSIIALTDAAGTTRHLLLRPLRRRHRAHRDHREPLPVHRRAPRPLGPVQDRSAVLRPPTGPVDPTRPPAPLGQPPEPPRGQPLHLRRQQPLQLHRPHRHGINGLRSRGSHLLHVHCWRHAVSDEQSDPRGLHSRGCGRELVRLH